MIYRYTVISCCLHASPDFLPIIQDMCIPLPGPPAADPPQVVVVQEPVPPTPNLL